MFVTQLAPVAPLPVGLHHRQFLEAQRDDLALFAGIAHPELFLICLAVKAYESLI